MQNRNLRFKSFSEAEEEIMNLRGKTVKTTGNWSYSQILCHLADGLEFMLFGGEPEFLFPAFLQMTAGKLIWEWMLFQGQMIQGLPNPVKKISNADNDWEKEYERLLSLIKKYELWTGDFVPHPVFGTLTKNEWGILQAFHFANHLSYVTV